jgi:hypothetical protein
MDESAILLNVQHRGRRIGVERVDAVEVHESLSAGGRGYAYGGAITRARRNAADREFNIGRFCQPYMGMGRNPTTCTRERANEVQARAVALHAKRPPTL